MVAKEGQQMAIEDGGGVLIVGLKLPAAENELLTWTLSNFTTPGDCVLGLHIVPLPEEHNSSTDVSKKQGLRKKQIADSRGSNASFKENRVTGIFDPVNSVYEGICCMKKVALRIEVRASSSVKKTLIQVAKSYGASKLILGTSGKKSSLGSSYSLAKYCSKQLPSTCSVIVIRYGKVVSQRDGSLEASGTTDKSHVQNQTRAILCSGGQPFQTSPIRNATYCMSHIDSNSILFSAPDLNSSGSTTGTDKSDLSNGYEVTRLSSSGSSASVEDSYDIGRDSPGVSHSLGFEKHIENILDGSDELLQGASEDPSCVVGKNPRVGWPLLHRSISNAASRFPKVPPEDSVVNWALQLPDRWKEVSMTDGEILEGGRFSIGSQFHCNSRLNLSDVRSSLSASSFIPSNESSICGRRSVSIYSRTVIAEQTKTVLCDDIQVKDMVCHPPQPDSLIHHIILEGLEEQVTSLLVRLRSLCEGSFCKEFDFMELNNATEHFSAGNLVGEGGGSQVYRGVLSDRRIIAVKRLNLSIQDAEQEMMTEVEMLSALHHPCIVSLIGYCVAVHNFLLVYNFVSEGSLEQILHDAKGKPVLSWKIRQKIAEGVSEALDYLHDGCKKSVIHRDVKTSNILLTSDFEPQLADFGLAKWASTTSTHLTCPDVVGTFGYLAPEYFMYGKVSEKTDVYAFGVVLLELLTGNRPIDNMKPKGQENLVMWARPLLQNNQYTAVIDPKLEGIYNTSQVRNMALAAALCLRPSPQSRPRINRILKLLRGGEDEQVGLWARQQLACPSDIDEGYGMPRKSDCCDIRTHLRLALVGLDDDVASEASTDHSIDLIQSGKSFEEYLHGRYSRPSSFN